MAYSKLRPRRGTKAEWDSANPILMESELAIECPSTGVGTGVSKFKLGDGKTRWKDLPYAFESSGTATSIRGGTADPNNHNVIALRADTTLNWETYDEILEKGELVLDLDKMSLKAGDGMSRFSQLPYIGSNTDFDFGDLDEEE